MGNIGSWFAGLFDSLPYTDSSGDGIIDLYIFILGNYPQWTFPNDSYGDINSTSTGGGFSGTSNNSIWQTYGQLSNVQILTLTIPTLSNEQITWLSNPHNSLIVDELISILSEFDEITDEEQLAAKITIDTYIAGIQNAYIENTIAEIVQSYYPTIQLTDPILQKYFNYVTLKIATLKKENPTWSDNKIAFYSNLDIIHLSLDLLTFIPPVSGAAILINGVLYLYEGNGSNAALTLASAVPLGVIIKDASYFAKFFINPLGKKIMLPAFKNTITRLIEFGQ